MRDSTARHCNSRSPSPDRACYRASDRASRSRHSSTLTWYSRGDGRASTWRGDCSCSSGSGTSGGNSLSNGGSSSSTRYRGSLSYSNGATTTAAAAAATGDGSSAYNCSRGGSC